MYRVPLLCISKLLKRIFVTASFFPRLFCFVFCLFVSFLLTSEYTGMYVVIINLFCLSCSMIHYCTGITEQYFIWSRFAVLNGEGRENVK